jgi:hypothetical protein
MPLKKPELESASSSTYSEEKSEARESTTDEKPIVFDADWLNQFVSLPQDIQHSEIDFAQMKDELKRTQEENRLLKEQMAVLQGEKLSFNFQLIKLMEERDNARNSFQKLLEQAKAFERIAKDNKRIVEVLQAQLLDQTRRVEGFFSLPIERQLMEIVRKHLNDGTPLSTLLVSLMDEIYLMLICDRAFIIQNKPKEHVEFLLNQQKDLIQNAIAKLQELLTFVQNDLRALPSSVQGRANDNDSVSGQSPVGSPALLTQFLTQTASAAKPTVDKKQEQPLVPKASRPLKKSKQSN